MTFKEAVEKLRAMNIPHSSVKYEHCFYGEEGGHQREEAECGIYTARYGGIWASGKTWDQAFTLLEANIARRYDPPPIIGEGAPE